jgi:hypothetical protein
LATRHPLTSGWIDLARLGGDVALPGRRDLQGLEHRALLGQHWWSAAELAASTGSFIPAQLASPLDKLLADGPPPRPIDISSPS